MNIPTTSEDIELSIFILVSHHGPSQAELFATASLAAAARVSPGISTNTNKYGPILPAIEPCFFGVLSVWNGSRPRSVSMRHIRWSELLQYMPPVIPSYADLHPLNDSRGVQLRDKYTEKRTEPSYYVVYCHHDWRDSVSLGET